MFGADRNLREGDSDSSLPRVRSGGRVIDADPIGRSNERNWKIKFCWGSSWLEGKHGMSYSERNVTPIRGLDPGAKLETEMAFDPAGQEDNGLIIRGPGPPRLGRIETEESGIPFLVSGVNDKLFPIAKRRGDSISVDGGGIQTIDAERAIFGVGDKREFDVVRSQRGNNLDA